MARSAFAAIGTRDLLELRDVNHSTAIARHA
jgi:hypothetical protein